MKTFFSTEDKGKIYLVGLEALGLIDLEISDFYEQIPIYKSGKKIIELNSEGILTVMNEEQFFDLIEELKEEFAFENDYTAYLENNVIILDDFSGELNVCVRDYRGNEYDNFDLQSCIKLQDGDFDVVYIELPDDCKYTIPEFFIEDTENIFEKVSSIKPDENTKIYVIGDAHFTNYDIKTKVEDINWGKKHLEVLKAKLKFCVEEENYEEAEEIKKQIDKIEKDGKDNI